MLYAGMQVLSYYLYRILGLMEELGIGTEVDRMV